MELRKKPVEGQSTSADELKVFLSKRRTNHGRPLTAVSLFSGAGISDVGYELAGFRFQVQVEREEARAAIACKNFPHSKWIIDSVETASCDIINAFHEKTKEQLDLLVATPPCQGMSSSNPSRGKRRTRSAEVNDSKNSLILELVPIAAALRPRVIVSENVRQILTHVISQGGTERKILDLLVERLPDYEFFLTCINVADYGIPQTRHRALVVGVRRDEPWLSAMKEKKMLPWPNRTHGSRAKDGRRPWLTLREWFGHMEYSSLSSRTPDAAKNGHPLHCVPHYDPDRYLLVSCIPAHSGRSAYENDVCLHCGTKEIAVGLAVCPNCGKPMKNRPIVMERTGPRLIKGFKSSYRRMRSAQPAPTVTTNSSHVGSDNKIHPWEDRVLSILECADLQTVPRFFDWSSAFETRRTYLIRNVIGEAFPSYFTYLHGRILKKLLRDDKSRFSDLAGPLPA